MGKKFEKSLVCGVGVNDSLTRISETVNGKEVFCPFYKRWSRIVYRCYSEVYQNRNPHYKGCSVSAEWLLFSNFRDWMKEQLWEGNHIDKDILFVGNKVYSEDTCRFIHPVVNLFVTDSRGKRGKWPLGVHMNNSTGSFVARCSNPLTKENEYLGIYKDPDVAHIMWRKRKAEIAEDLCSSEYVWDNDIRNALLKRYI